MDKLANAIAEGVESTLKTLATFWLNVPSPTGLGLSSTIVSMQDWLGPITATVAIIGVIIALTYMGWTGQLRAGGEAGTMLIKLIIVSGAGTTGVAILIASGDLFSPWNAARMEGNATTANTRLAVFLLARIAEDEARAANGPEEARREARARRSLVEIHGHRGDHGGERCGDPCYTLKILAQRYRDHPDCRPRPRPDRSSRRARLVPETAAVETRPNGLRIGRALADQTRSPGRSRSPRARALVSAYLRPDAHVDRASSE
jgi:hypothetical protein